MPVVRGDRDGGCVTEGLAALRSAGREGWRGGGWGLGFGEGRRRMDGGIHE